jgi:hypothetical protein
VSRVGIEYDRGFELEYMDTFHSIDADRFTSLLRTAATISPQELVFTNTFDGRIKADLLCFRCAMSIEMNLYIVRFTQLPDGEFSALERLWLTEGSSIVDLATLIARCPRLRVLKVTADESSAGDVVRVHSASLEELDINVCKDTTCQGTDNVTPMLKQLSLPDHGNADLSVSISAPMMGKVSWICSYEGLALVFGIWSLVILKIETVEVNKDNEWVLN